MNVEIWRYRLARGLGRFVTRAAAALTLGQMPPFTSTSAVVVRGEEVLVVVDSLRDEPVLPGGHLKWSERPHDALVREVREETGCIVEPGRLIGVFAGREWAGEEGVVRIVYEAELTGGALRSSGEGTATWMPVADLARSDTRDAPLMRIWQRERAALESSK
jgi:ADP-ribose pyrophosphatase YjhB (NUDIX family)